jgi:DNA-binding NarL/FixJ family response regulator
VKPLLPEAPPPSVVAYEIHPGQVLFVHDLPAVSKVPGLGKVEQEVLELLLRGHDNRSIAAKPGTSTRTVSNQLTSIFRKLGVCSRAELMANLLTR